MLNLRTILAKVLRYEIPLRLEKRSWGFRIGLFLACLHFAFFVSNTLYIIEHNEGRWHMFWILCGYIDFPASLLLSKIILPVFSHFFTNRDPYLVAVYNSPMFVIFSLFHILVGSAWYFALPVLLEKAGKKITATALTLTAAVAIMLIPIFTHWLQLLRFIAHDVKNFAPVFNSILPVIWTALLVWLFFATARKKSVLWLLLLTPFVFYYFVRDLYCYTMLTGPLTGR
jgi:hypothetical protein